MGGRVYDLEEGEGSGGCESLVEQIRSGEEQRFDRKWNDGGQSIVGSVATDDGGTFAAAFGGQTKEEVTELLLEYAYEGLAAEGKDTDETRRILRENMPEFTNVNSNRDKPKITASFDKVAKGIEPFAEGEYISVTEWAKMANQAASGQGWSLASRFRFMTETGGLKEDVHESARERVLTLMETTETWMPNYAPARDEENFAEWLYCWMDWLVKMIVEFHIVLDTKTVKKGLDQLFKLEKYRFAYEDDPLNKDFWRVATLYNEALVYLKKRSSNLVKSPLYTFDLVMLWLQNQGWVGVVMEEYITEALGMLETNPASVFPKNHRKGARGEGSANCKEATYVLVFEGLRHRAGNNGLKDGCPSCEPCKRSNRRPLL